MAARPSHHSLSGDRIIGRRDNDASAWIDKLACSIHLWCDEAGRDGFVASTYIWSNTMDTI